MPAPTEPGVKVDNRLATFIYLLITAGYISEEQARHVADTLQVNQSDETPVFGYCLNDEEVAGGAREIADAILAGIYTPDGELPWASDD